MSRDFSADRYSLTGFGLAESDPAVFLTVETGYAQTD
jgi:hypothetical protein